MNRMLVENEENLSSLAMLNESLEEADENGGFKSALEDLKREAALVINGRDDVAEPTTAICRHDGR